MVLRNFSLEASPQDVCQQEAEGSSKKGLRREKRGSFADYTPPDLLLPVSTLVNERLIDWWLLGW